MSAAPVRTAHLHQQTATAPAPRPHLSIAPLQERARSIAPFAWLCVGIVIAALAAVLIINTVLSEGAYASQETKIEIAQLHQQQADLLISLESNAAPAALAERATALGMVPAPHVGFVSLADDAVLKESGA